MQETSDKRHLNNPQKLNLIQIQLNLNANNTIKQNQLRKIAYLNKFLYFLSSFSIINRIYDFSLFFFIFRVINQL